MQTHGRVPPILEAGDRHAAENKRCSGDTEKNTHADNLQESATFESFLELQPFLKIRAFLRSPRSNGTFMETQSGNLAEHPRVHGSRLEAARPNIKMLQSLKADVTVSYVVVMPQNSIPPCDVQCTRVMVHLLILVHSCGYMCLPESAGSSNAAD